MDPSYQQKRSRETEEKSLKDEWLYAVLSILGIVLTLFFYLREVGKEVVPEAVWVINLTFSLILISIGVLYAINYLMKQFKKIDKTEKDLKDIYDELINKITTLDNKVNLYEDVAALKAQVKNLEGKIK